MRKGKMVAVVREKCSESKGKTVRPASDHHESPGKTVRLHRQQRYRGTVINDPRSPPRTREQGLAQSDGDMRSEGGVVRKNPGGAPLSAVRSLRCLARFGKSA